MGPNLFDVLDASPAAPDAVLEGTATALLLALWGREATVTASGDEAVIAVLLS
jgi:hypothetical protein